MALIASVVVEEEGTTCQLAPSLPTNRVPQAAECSGIVLLARDPRFERHEAHQQHSLGVPEDGGRDLANGWLDPKLEWCQEYLVLKLCLWAPW